MSRRWTGEDISILKEELKLGTSHEMIGLVLDRTKSSVMHKVQRLGLANKNNNYSNWSKNDFIKLVQKNPTCSYYHDRNTNVPSVKTIIKHLNCKNWGEVLELSGLKNNPGGRYNENKITTFYILKFKDIDNTVFYKYGYTQRSIGQRYSSRPKDFEIIKSKKVLLYEALELENKFKNRTNKYIPKDTRFTSTHHGGYSECFISW